MQTYQVISAMVIPICHSSISVVVDEYCEVKKHFTLTVPVQWEDKQMCSASRKPLRGNSAESERTITET